MGGTGHVGAAVAEALLRRGLEVTIITRDPGGAAGWSAKGAHLHHADLEDVDALRAGFQRASRAFLLNPPADPSTDIDVTERRTAAAIVSALDGAGLEKVVVASTYGAQAGRRVGDLSVLWEFEQALGSQSTPTAINRGAYYFSNWDAQLEPVRETGRLSTMFPPDMRIPMVAPADLGEVAAARLLTPASEVGVQYVEGPAHYSAADVAQAFADALDRDVEVDVVGPADWEAAFESLGFSPEAADSYARMTRVSVDGDFEMPVDPRRGPTTLEAYISALVRGG